MRKALTLLLVSLCAAAADPSLVAPLVRNAWYWQARARSDKAEEAWKQVLQAAPDNPEALAALGGFNARAGHVDQARQELEKLQKVSPGHPDVPVLRRELEVGPRFGAMLARARKLVHEGHPAEGAAAYRELFGDAGPPGDLALEYYQSLGGAKDGWEQSRDGLRRLVRRAPAEVRYKLALGKLLTYREESRREGIELLASLSRDPTVGKDAAAAWRQALVWLSPTGADAPLFKAYTKTHTNDTEIAKRMEHGRRSESLKGGFAALERGDLATAERVFRSAGDDPEARRGLALLADRRSQQASRAGFAALERGDLRTAEDVFGSLGDDPNARLGLALIAQRQALALQRSEDFAGAQQLLERAKQLVPQRRDLWEEPLRSVTFWGLVREARLLGRSDEAVQKLRTAIGKAPPAERWHAELALADVLAARGDRKQAESHYRDVLLAVPDQPDCLRALAALLVGENRYEEAVPVNERLARVAPQKAFAPQWLRAQILRGDAARRVAAHDAAGARIELEEARALAPDDLWLLHDYANVLVQLGALEEAAQAVAALLQKAPALPEARIVEARLLSAQGNDAQALALLDAMTPTSADPSVAALRRRLAVSVRIPELLQAASLGDVPAAVQGLTALEETVQDEPELAAHVAVAWSKLGEHPRGVALMRKAMARAPGVTRGARLELASTLLDAGDEAAVTQILSGLDRDPSLTADERTALGELRIAQAVRLADKLRESDQAAKAHEALEPVLRDYPRDVRVVAAQARVLEHEDAGRAHALYLLVLDATPGDVDALRGAVDTALLLGNADEARRLSSREAERNPDDARVQLIAARVAVQQGDDSEAMSLLRRGLALVEPAEVARDNVRLEGGASTQPLEPGGERLAAMAVNPLVHDQIRREMRAIDERHRRTLRVDLDTRLRDGEPGLSQLTEYREALTLDMPAGYDARATFRATVIELDAGGVGPNAAARFGSGAATGQPAGTAAAPGSQQAVGTELRVGVESRYLSATLATTPLGFPLFALTGGVRVHAPLGPVTFAVEAGRRNVTESLLSYAGAYDPQSGTHWGGVVMDGGRVDLGLAGKTGSLYAYGELHRLIGLNVADNRRLAGGAGAAYHLYEGALGLLSVGPTFAALSFDRNLRFFTYGHGGYFSPQRFVHGGAALTWRRGGDLRWELAAEPGVDAFIEGRSPAFPLSADQRGTAPYAGRPWGAGASFNGHATLGWKIADGWETGLVFALQRAPQFQELSAGVLLRAGVGH